LPLSVPLSRLLERGYSAKKGHEGIGLSTITKLSDSIPYANLYTKYETTVFCQSLEIQKEKYGRYSKDIKKQKYRLHTVKLILHLIYDEPKRM